MGCYKVASKREKLNNQILGHNYLIVRKKVLQESIFQRNERRCSEDKKSFSNE